MLRLTAPVVRITGRTKHAIATVVDDKPMAISPIAAPATVEIRETEEGFYLLRLDVDGQCLADTWHLTVGDAKEQARFEYDIAIESWNAC